MRLRRPLPAVQGDTLHIVGVGDNRIGKLGSSFRLPSRPFLRWASPSSQGVCALALAGAFLLYRVHDAYIFSLLRGSSAVVRVAPGTKRQATWSAATCRSPKTIRERPGKEGAPLFSSIGVNIVRCARVRGPQRMRSREGQFNLYGLRHRCVPDTGPLLSRWAYRPCLKPSVQVGAPIGNP